MSDPMLDGCQELCRQWAIHQRPGVARWLDVGFEWTLHRRLAVVNDRYADRDTFVANIHSRRSVTWAGNQVLNNAVSLMAKGTAESDSARHKLATLNEIHPIQQTGAPFRRFAPLLAIILHDRHA